MLIQPETNLNIHNRVKIIPISNKIIPKIGNSSSLSPSHFP